MRLPFFRQFKRLLVSLSLAIGTVLLILGLHANLRPSIAQTTPVLTKFPDVNPLPFNAESHNVQLALSLAEASAVPTAASTSAALELDRQGKTYYQQGQLDQAITVWKQAADAFAAQGDRVHQAMTLSRLALAYQYLGQWDNANPTIRQSLDLLQQSPQGARSEHLKILAEALTIQGSLQLEQGQAANAFTSWLQAANTFQQAGDRAGVIRSQLNQTQALLTLGLYRRANKLLEALYEQKPAEESLQLAILLNYGETLRLVGRLEPNSLVSAQPEEPANSTTILQKGLELAQKLKSPADITAAQISLGNTYRALYQKHKRWELNCPDPTTAKFRQDALNLYQQAAEQAQSASSKIQALLNQQSLLLVNDLLDGTSPDAAQVQTIVAQIQAQLDRLPLSRTVLYSRIQLAKNGLSSDPNQAAQLLEEAVKQAESLGDRAAQSYALGYLGQAYEQQRQRSGENAKELTNQALNLTTRAKDLAKTLNAPEIAYRWFWQLGRLQRDSDPDRAIPNYRTAYQLLQVLRTDLAANNPELQFSFRERPVEPVYREFVDLLLQSQPTTKQALEKPTKDKDPLEEARDVIQDLAGSELANFLQEPCGQSNLQAIDRQVDEQGATAMLYTILLPDRIEVIAKVPKKPLFHYFHRLSRQVVQQKIDQFQRDLQESYTFDAVQQEGQEFYKWLIQPVQTELQNAGIKTIVFSLDGPLRNIPMAALYDGQHYLIQNYAVSVTLDLKIEDPQPLRSDRLSVLAASLSKPSQQADDAGKFAELTFVNEELKAIEATNGIRPTLLQDDQFTRDRFNQQFNNSTFQIVHLATHGRFSSRPEETFILTAPSPLPNGKVSDGKVRLQDFDEMFRTRALNQKQAIELLILSACETASGDDRATLGIAGTAVKAGANSAIASLWSLDDQSSQKLIEEFYRAITQPNTSRAKALQQAQLALLQQEQGNYAHPRYWAPFLLVGNWL